jgi:hypothetical protein
MGNLLNLSLPLLLLLLLLLLPLLLLLLQDPELKLLPHITGPAEMLITTYRWAVKSCRSLCVAVCILRCLIAPKQCSR